MVRVFLFAEKSPARQVMGETLKRLGAKVTICEDFRAASTTLQATSFDVLVIDEECCSNDELRSLRQLQKEIPVWLLTEDLETPSILRQANFLLFKPIDIRVLQHVHARSRAREIAPSR